MKSKCLIVDDEPLARKLLLGYIAKIESLELVRECSSAIEAGNFIRTTKIDLLFLDIQMPELNGMQFISTLKNPPSVIITTAYRDFAPEAFDINAVDYLLKPISFERFAKSVNRFFDKQTELTAIDNTSLVSPSAFIYLKADRKSHRVMLSDIRYIESLDDYVKVHLTGSTLITRENISSLEAALPGVSFVRIHRSYIINTNFITSISADTIEIDQKCLPMGRAFKKSALALLNLKISKEQKS
jgi:DNA-binding LytR/AlgR family response regulator